MALYWSLLDVRRNVWSAASVADEPNPGELPAVVRVDDPEPVDVQHRSEQIRAGMNPGRGRMPGHLSLRGGASVALAAGKGAGDPDRDIDLCGAESRANLVQVLLHRPLAPIPAHAHTVVADSHVEPNLVPEARASAAHRLGQIGISRHRSRAPSDSVATEERRAENRVMAERERIVEAASGPVRHLAEEPRILRLDAADLAATHLPGAGLSDVSLEERRTEGFRRGRNTAHRCRPASRYASWPPRLIRSSHLGTVVGPQDAPRRQSSNLPTVFA